MSKGTPIRNLRVPDGLWQAALEKAAREGTTVSAYLIECLKKWTAKP